MPEAFRFRTNVDSNPQTRARFMERKQSKTIRAWVYIEPQSVNPVFFPIEVVAVAGMIAGTDILIPGIG
jgi:hypothetical protein